MSDSPVRRHPGHRAQRRAPVGAAPGTLKSTPGAAPPEIRVIAYGPKTSPEKVTDLTLSDLGDLKPPQRGESVRWIDVTGVGDAASIERIGQIFGLHPLALGDIVNVSQRPKVEVFDDFLFIVTRMPRLVRDGAPVRLETEQLAIAVGKRFVLTFQEYPGDALHAVRERIRAPVSRIRTRGPDYLAYAIIDAVIDSYFPLLEAYGDGLEDLETEVVERPRQSHIADIHDLKRNMLTIRRAVWPQREMISTLIRDDTPFIARETRLFLRDCYDHTVQLIDMIETFREIASDLVDIQLSSASNRMNEVMKVLTIIATIFIPLTFVAGVYGMNFDPDAGPFNMPELRWAWGYPAALGLMLVITGGLLIWFRHKGWLGERKRRRQGPEYPPK